MEVKVETVLVGWVVGWVCDGDNDGKASQEVGKFGYAIINLT